MVEAGSDHKAVPLGRRCVACQADAWLLLPVPNPVHSMLSDGEILQEPLKKCSCSNCGLVQHVGVREDDDVRKYFGSSYALSDHQPNIGFEGGRQRQYADWIVGSLGHFRPGSILELGCGNGSLLRELMTRFPSATAIGLESSERGVTWAQRSGLPVQRAYIEGENSVRGLKADLVVSINVIEHTPRPVGFLRAAKAAVNDGGLVLVVCPDGSEIGSELLFLDHLYSLCPSNLGALVRSSGLIRVDHQRSPSELPGFQMVLAAASSAVQGQCQERALFDTVDVRKLHAARGSYLTRWKELDAKLSSAMDGYRTATVFGTGEMAQLIRAYAPTAWTRVSSFVIDDPTQTEFFGRPVFPYAELKATPSNLILLAVASHSVPKVSARLRAAGHRVLAMDDLYSPSSG